VSVVTQVSDEISEDRARTLRRLLSVVLGLSGLLVLVALLYLLGDQVKGGTTILVIAALFGGLSGLSLRAVARRAPSAHRLVVATSVVLIVFSVLLVGIFIGLLTVIVGIGLLAVLYAPEREES
jgi:FtsH-binding integral membrane protein